MSLCDDCYEAHNKWLDYRVRTPFQFHQVDDSLRGALDNRKHRSEGWADTIRWQQALIKDICTREHQAAK